MSRHRATTGAVLAAAMVLAACGTGGDEQVADGLAPATASCATAEPQVPQAGNHLIGDTAPPVAYSSDPPTSGWHASGAGTPAGAYTTPMSEPDQVAVLERGGVAVVHDPDLTPDEVARLLELGPALVAEGLDVVVVPHVRSLPTAVTLTAWGTLQRCDADVPVGDVLAFAARHADDSEAD